MVGIKSRGANFVKFHSGVVSRKTDKNRIAMCAGTPDNTISGSYRWTVSIQDNGDLSCAGITGIERLVKNDPLLVAEP